MYSYYDSMYVTSLKVHYKSHIQDNDKVNKIPAFLLHCN
jgi:hypothetical protein